MPLKKIKKGDIARAEDFNALVDELTRLANIRVSTGLGYRSSENGQQFWLTGGNAGWMGIIQPLGPSSAADYTDNRFWCVPARLTTTESDADTDKAKVDKVSTSSYASNIVTVTNLWPFCGHTLVPGTPVWVWDELPINCKAPDFGAGVRFPRDDHGLCSHLQPEYLSISLDGAKGNGHRVGGPSKRTNRNHIN